MKSKTTKKKPLSKSAKVTLVLIFLVTVALIVLMCFSDTLFDKYTEYFLEKHFGQESVVGNFICQEFKNIINLKGLSEEGKLRECIFIPQNPKREGYKFAGWYKEKDCKNMWSFSKDIVQKATYNTELKENKLFAKWIKE